MLTPEQIITFDDSPPPAGESPYVNGSPVFEAITIMPSSDQWPVQFAVLAEKIRLALADRALEITHVGSTSVPGLPAKPIIDIDLTVENSAEEAAWLPPLEAAGFYLSVREPWWYEHRGLKLAEPRCNLHVFSPDSPELVRHKLFRDWLMAHPEDLALYRDTKVMAAKEANSERATFEDYNSKKTQVIRDIYKKAFVAAGYLSP